MTIRVLYNYVLVRLGLRRILPAEIVNRKEVRECGEEMVKTHSDYITYANSEDNYARLGVMTLPRRSLARARMEGSACPGSRTPERIWPMICARICS